MTVVSAAMLLFLVMDPLGNIPFFLSALSRVDPRRQRTVVVRELLIALAVLMVAIFSGLSGIVVAGRSQKLAPWLCISGLLIATLFAAYGCHMIFHKP